MCWIGALPIQFVLASTLFVCVRSVNEACVWCNSSAERNFVSCLTQFISERPEFPDYAKKNLDIVMQKTINAIENTENTDEQAVSKIEALNTAMVPTSFKVLLESDEFQEKRNKASILIRGINQCLVQTSLQDSDLMKNIQNTTKRFVAAGNNTNAEINQAELIVEPNSVQQVNDGKHVVGQGANQTDLSDSLNKSFEVYSRLLKPIKEKLKENHSPSRDVMNSLSKLLTGNFLEAKQYPETPLSPTFTIIPANDPETQLLQVKNESMAFYDDYENGRNEEGQNISRFLNMEQNSSIFQNNKNFVDNDRQSPLKLLNNMSLRKLNPDNKEFEQTNRINRKLLSLEKEEDEKRTQGNVWQINPNFQEQKKILWPMKNENTVPEDYGLHQTNKWSDMQDVETFSRSGSRNIEQKDLFGGQGSKPKILADFTETETQSALQTRYNDFGHSVASSELHNTGMQSTRPEIQESRAQASDLETEDAKARTFLLQENKPEFNGFGIQHSLPQGNTGHPTGFRMQQPVVQIVTAQENMEQPNNQYGMPDLTKQTLPPRGNEIQPTELGVQRLISQPFQTQSHTASPNGIEIQIPSVQMLQLQRNTAQPIDLAMRDLSTQTFPSQRSVAQNFPPQEHLALPVISGIQNSMQKDILPQENLIRPADLAIHSTVQSFPPQKNIAKFNQLEIQDPMARTVQTWGNIAQPTELGMQHFTGKNFQKQESIAQPTHHGLQIPMGPNFQPQESTAKSTESGIQHPVMQTFQPQESVAKLAEVKIYPMMQRFQPQGNTAQSTEHKIQDLMEETLKSQGNEAQRNEFKIYNSMPPTFPLEESIAHPTEFKIQYPVADAFQIQGNMALPTKLEIQNPSMQTYQLHGNIAHPTKQEIQGPMAHGFIPQENIVEYTKFKIQDPVSKTAHAEGDLVQPTKSGIQHLKVQSVPPQDYPAQFTELEIHDSVMQTQPQGNLTQLSEHRIRDPIERTFQPQISTAHSSQVETYTQVSEPFLTQVKKNEAQAAVVEILEKAIKNILMDARNHQTQPPPLQEIQETVTQSSSTKEPGNVAQTITGSEVQAKMTQYPAAKPQEMITNLPWPEVEKHMAQSSWPKIQENNMQHFESDGQKNTVHSTMPEMTKNGILTPSPDERVNKFDNETQPSEQKINLGNFRDGITNGDLIKPGNQESEYQKFPETEIKALPLEFKPSHNETIGLESVKQTFSKEQSRDGKTKLLPKSKQTSLLSGRKLLAIAFAQTIYNNLTSSEIFSDIFNDNMTESYRATLTYSLVKQSMSEYNTTISTNAATRVRESVLSTPRYTNANDLARIFAGEISKTLYKWKLINAEPKQQALKISEKILQSLTSLQQTPSTNTPNLTKTSSEYEKLNASESLSLHTPTKLMPLINKNEIPHNNAKVLSRSQNQFMGNSYYGRNCNKSLSALNSTNTFSKTDHQKSSNVNPVSTSNSFIHFNKSEPFQNNSLFISKKECLLKSQLLWITNNPMYKFFNTFSNISMRSILDNMNFTENGMENSIKNFSCIVEKQIAKSSNNNIKEKLTKLYYDVLKIVMLMI